MKINLGEIIIYLITSFILSLVLWGSLILSKYEIPDPTWFFHTLRFSFSSPPILKITLESLFGGFALGLLTFPIFRRTVPGRKRTKGFVRGADLGSPGQVLKQTRSAKSGNQTTIAKIPIPPDLETLHFLIGGSN